MDVHLSMNSEAVHPYSLGLYGLQRVERHLGHNYTSGSYKSAIQIRVWSHKHTYMHAHIHTTHAHTHTHTFPCKHTHTHTKTKNKQKQTGT